MPDENQLSDESEDSLDDQLDDPLSDPALDDLLNNIQSEDPMNNINEPQPGEDIDDLIPPESKETKKDEKTEGKVESKPESKSEQPKDSSISGIGKEFIGDIKDLIAVAKERFREDRDEAQEVIDYLKQVVLTNPKPSVGLVEALVQALKVKTDATANITRIGDMASRALSAGRDHIGKDSSAQQDLSALYEALSEPDYKDEEDRKNRRGKD